MKFEEIKSELEKLDVSKSKLETEMAKQRAVYDVHLAKLKDLGLNSPEEIDGEIQKLEGSLLTTQSELEIMISQIKVYISTLENALNGNSK